MRPLTSDEYTFSVSQQPPGPHSTPHPGHSRPGHPGAGATAIPTHPDVRSAVPRGVQALAVGLAWLRAAALCGFLIAIGRGVDALASGHDPVAAALALAALGAIVAATSAADKLVTARVQAHAESHLRQRIVASVFRGGLVAAQSRSGALLALATGSAERAARYRGAFLGPTIGALTTPVPVLIIAAVAIDPVVGLLLAGGAVLVPGIVVIARRTVRASGAAQRRTQAQLTAEFLRSIQGLSTLVTARAADRAGVELANRGERLRRALMRVLAVNQVLILVIDAAVTLTVLLVAALTAVSRVEAGALSIGEGLSVILIALLVIAPADLVGQFFYIGIGGRAAEQAISRQLARAPRSATAAGQGSAESEQPASPQPGHDATDRTAISLDGVTAGWTPGQEVLRDRTLQVRTGEHVALAGPSGAGKSTVSALVQAHLLPTAGQVTLLGADTRTTPPREIRRMISVVEQRTFLFHGTIAENLRVARPHATDAELWDALGQAGLEAEIRNSDHGLDTPVGEQGRNLSGGQSQRLAIARAILRDSPILILDEPTSQVDLAGEAAFLQTLEHLASGRTVLMIAHRPGAILAADRVEHLDAAGAAR